MGVVANAVSFARERESPDVDVWLADTVDAVFDLAGRFPFVDLATPIAISAVPLDNHDKRAAGEPVVVALDVVDVAGPSADRRRNYAADAWAVRRDLLSRGSAAQRRAAFAAPTDPQPPPHVDASAVLDEIRNAAVS